MGMQNSNSSSHCPICRHAGLLPVRRIDQWHLKKCIACGSVCLDPMPTPEELGRYYDDLYDGASAGYFSKIDKKLARSRGRIRQLHRYVSAGRFLDVGCNGGFMVEAAREQGFDAMGIDLDPISIAFAQDHYGDNRFHHGLVQDVVDQEAPFDLIYSSEVIEHVPDPQVFVESLWALAKPGAVLFITTPDMGHWTVPKDLANWPGFMVPEHCLYFTAPALKSLFEGQGFEFLRRRWAFKAGIKMLFRRPAY